MTSPTHLTEAPLRRRKIFDTSFIILCGIALAAGCTVGLLHGWARVVEITGRNLGFLGLLMPKITAGVFVAAALPLLIPRARLASWVGQESGIRGLLLATLAGALVPGGPMMTFPLAASFLAAGAGLGTTVAFVTSWSLLGLNRTIIWELSFLHAEFVALRMLICLPLPVLCGLAVQGLVRR